MTSVIIAGDSWGLGEWGGNITYGISHKGIEQYFNDYGFRVENVSSPGASNKFSISLLSQTLQSKSFDYIFWFQSEPLRDIPPINFKSVLEISEKQYDLLVKSYTTLNEIGQPVYCLGGCSKINVEMISSFHNLIPVIPSITEFLLQDYKHPSVWQSNPDVVIPENYLDLDSLKQVINWYEEKLRLSNYTEMFYPDGSHPNRYGHKIIYNYIMENVIGDRF